MVALTLAAALGPVPLGPVATAVAWAVAGVLIAAAVLALPSRGDARLLPALIVVAAISLALAGADLALRAFAGDDMYYRPEERFLRRWAGMPGLLRFRPNVVWEGPIGGDLAAMSRAAHGERRHARFVTDEHGFRNDPAAPSGRPWDTIVLGDSFGFGSGVSQDETFAAVLAREGGRTVYNLSMIGSPWQGAMNFMAEAARLRPAAGATVVWLLFSGNDLDEHYGRQAEPDVLHGWQRSLLGMANAAYAFWRRSPTRHLLLTNVGGQHSASLVLARALPDGRRVLFFEPYVRAMRRSHEAVVGHPNYGALERSLRAMTSRTRGLGLRLALVVAPPKAEVYRWLVEERAPWSVPAEPSGFSEALRRLAGAADVPFLDLGPELVRESRALWEGSRALTYSADDTHWNAAGHAAVARLIAARVLGRAF
jgi:lysophospholipase L1-like esterase